MDGEREIGKFWDLPVKKLKGLLLLQVWGKPFLTKIAFYSNGNSVEIVSSFYSVSSPSDLDNKNSSQISPSGSSQACLFLRKPPEKLRCKSRRNQSSSSREGGEFCLLLFRGDGIQTREIGRRREIAVAVVVPLLLFGSLRCCNSPARSVVHMLLRPERAKKLLFLC